MLRLLNGGNNQAPDGGGGHNAGGKAHKPAANIVAEGFSHKKYAGGAEEGSDKGDKYSVKDIHI